MTVIAFNVKFTEKYANQLHDVNFSKYSNVSFLTFVCTVFISSKNHIQVLNKSSKAGAALVKTITSYIITNVISGELSRENMISSHVKRSPLLWLHNKSRLLQ